MKKKRISSFDELITNYYGASGRSDPGDALGVEELFANYYGKAAQKDRNARTTSATVLSLSYDNGETIAQRPQQQGFEEYVVQQSTGRAQFEEYIVQQSTNGAEFEEYVVTGGALSQQSSIAARSEVIPAEEVSAFQEYQVDLLQPLNQAPSPGPRTGASVSRPQTPLPLPPSRADRPERPADAAQLSPASQESSRAQATDEDFMADLQSILTGQKVFDPFSKKTVDKEQVGRQQSMPSQHEPNELPAPEAKNSQAIFDRIAQSMQYANAYDLGTVELENRFADFDKLAAVEEKVAANKKSKGRQTPTTQMPSGVTIDSADFLQDLDAIRSQLPGTPVPPGISPKPSSTARGMDATWVTDAEIEQLNLADTAKKAAYALKAKHPSVTFTSGRRTKQQQARAMAGNIVQNRKWIEQTYSASSIRDACQKWVDDNPDKLTKEQIEQGLADVLNRYTDDELARFSKHIAGMAFDVQPIEAGAEEIKQTIRGLDGLDKFLEKEGGLVRWHVQFK